MRSSTAAASALNAAAAGIQADCSSRRGRARQVARRVRRRAFSTPAAGALCCAGKLSSTCSATVSVSSPAPAVVL